ncbi:regulator of sigma E protease [Xylanibacter ruminicola]|jgi:regulator of sigma E protease|uniref:Zinc metalloprotease n=1 Tax=Xylanibacter ruminicola TaxID=839 RepID=A0A1H5XE44_XYLRU|nr:MULTISPECIES: RIP metalloprotease RseP [Prevotellaceae]SEG09476.1 regulator of sigma E protease [Xylanibacter ruminicola]
MDIFLIRLLQFMLAIGLLVLLHEGGHFFFAKLFGIRVDKFYLFFDPSIWKWDGSIFKWKPKNSNTQYGMGWLPLGGYCKIAGMIDESFDTNQMKQPVQSWEFRAKPAWQRLLVMIGGVLVNFLLALFIYSMILFYWGDTYIPVKDMTLGMKFNAEAKALGFQDGDILLGTDKGTFKDFSADLYRDLSEAKRVDLVRDGQQMSLSLPGDINLLSMMKAEPSFVRPLVPAEVDSVMADSPAASMGLQKGDKIIAINDTPIDSYNEFTDQLGILEDMMAAAKTQADSMKVRTATIVYERNEARDTATVTLTSELKLGFFVKSLAGLYEPYTREYGFLESIPAGIKYGWNVLAGYVGDMKYVFTADGAKSIGGFGAIGSLFPPVWDWYLFWKMTAFLSIILAFMNILPIPALDGGHVLFLIYEMITRRKPSETFMIRAEYFGFGLLILLMVVANLNDILRWLGYM